MIKTDEEIQALKDNWVKDPSWDIEKTEGFEEHEDELLQFHNEMNAKWTEKDIARVEARTAKFFSETGIHDPLISESLYTFTEIENDLLRADITIGKCSMDALAQAILLQAHVRATLLLAAQIKRVGDLLGDKIDQDAGDRNTDFMTNLYKVD